MATQATKGLVLAAIVALANGDTYIHNPRGSNNRLNEKSANRNNGNRLFDSQNNNRGGYNVGDRTDDAFNGGDNANEAGTPFPNSLDKGQYPLTYYEASILNLEWTAQHGCGGNEADNAHKLNCNMVFQFACNTDNNQVNQLALQFDAKDGRNTNTPGDANNLQDSLPANQPAQNNNNGRGRHETEAWYYECTKRERNAGLFLADQDLGGDASRFTRQNPNGNRRGLECPEERDYYPYWHPSPWVDVAYLTSNPEDCGTGTVGEFDVIGQSQNTVEKMRCAGSTVAAQQAVLDAKADTAEACAAVPGATWTGYSHQVKSPVCQQGQWSRVNHLGNGVNGQALGFNWTMPLVNAAAQAADATGPMNLPTGAAIMGDVAKCVLRMRYNISTDDYDVRQTNYMSNDDPKNGVVSPVTENPTINIGFNAQGLRLAINTNQFGRTFQDRSHTFYLKKRGAAQVGKTIQNLNVRGKRCNIVQCFPAVEYDFIPNNMEVGSDHLIHLQWTGSNTHNNGNPAGDGQAGDAGEGTGGTDRHSLVDTVDAESNYPLALDKTDATTMAVVRQFDCFEGLTGTAKATWQDCAVHMATSGQYKTVAEASAATDFNPTLDDAPASLVGGLLLKPKTTIPDGTVFHYMASRNNNFSNRGQKAAMTFKLGA